MPWTETVLHLSLTLLKQNIRESIYWLQKPFIHGFVWVKNASSWTLEASCCSRYAPCMGWVDGVVEKRVCLLYFSPTLDLTVVTGAHTPENVSRVYGRVWLKPQSFQQHLEALSSENVMSWKSSTRIIKSNLVGSLSFLLSGTFSHWDIAAIFTLCRSKCFSTCFHPSSVLWSFIPLSLKNV